jgi:hypothetical protein
MRSVYPTALLVSKGNEEEGLGLALIGRQQRAGSLDNFMMPEVASRTPPHFPGNSSCAFATVASASDRIMPAGNRSFAL